MRVVIFTIFLFFSININAYDLITPIPQEIPHDNEKARLGQKLFFDPLLSYDMTVSCESCHRLSGDNITGADDKPLSKGIHGRDSTYNAPTVLNSVFNHVQFWDGRANSLKEQVMSPLHSSISMGMTDKLILHRLRSHDDYNYKFKKIYENGVSVENIADALAEFEKTLITPNSRFDQYLRGDRDILSNDEKRGYEAFKEVGCIVCHNGVNIGGNMMQNFGIFADLGILKEDKYSVNGDDLVRFKVPTLRNISKTAPYFHDGKVKTLNEAIELMSGYQLGRKLTKKEEKLIYKFLLTLEGEIPKTIYVDK